MKQCCENKEQEINLLKSSQAKALKVVFFINLIMFFVEYSASLKAHSTALMGDSLDMLGDAFVYGFSLYVLYKSERMRVRAAQLKGFIMLAFGVGVFIQAAHKIHTGIVPTFETMGIIGSIALLANVICLGILYSHRDDDINMKSTWICSRNDIVYNSGILIAAVLVKVTNSNWPDIMIGVFVAIVFMNSAWSVLKQSRIELNN